ncbi:MAG TPA: cysteine synthase family protein, partial [Nitrospirales bacterium]|nr:cysteine synthase family protein [Nitrospirales bacterium]
MLYSDLTEAIGHTPMIELRRLNPNPAVRIFAKLEGFNPTGSLKDRIVKYMIERAEASGELTPDKILLEPTSGNTGISLGMFAKIKGYPLRVVMPDNVSSERRELLHAFGVEVFLSPGSEGTNGAIRMAQKMLKEDDRHFMLDQYGNPNNVLAHYETTAGEILEDLKGTVDSIDLFIAGLGTGGTLMGAGRRLKEASDTEVGGVS